MKKEKIKVGKSEIEQLREIRDKISLEIQDMTFQELQKYIKDKLTLHPKSSWGKSK